MKRRTLLLISFAIFFLTANFSSRDSEARAEIREAYLFAVSGPILAMIVGIIVTGALTDYDPKIQEIKPTPTSGLSPQEREKNEALAISVLDLRGISQHRSLLCNHCPQQ